MNNVLITGASGFIGSTLINDFAKDFGNIIAISRSTVDRVPNPHVKNYVFDICEDGLVDIMQRNLPTAIIHTAAKSTVRDCELNPFEAFKLNVIGTVNVLESARKLKLDIPIIAFETDKVYGEQPASCIPTKETHALLGYTPYEYSKVMMSNVCDFYRNYYGMRIYSLRSTNIFGYWDRNLSRLIPNTFDKLMRGESPVVHKGSETQIRQYVYVNDVVKIVQLLIEKQPTPGSYNISSGQTRHAEQLVNEIKKATSISIPSVIKEKSLDFKELQTQIIDGSKLVDAIGIEYTRIEDALSEMWLRMVNIK